MAKLAIKGHETRGEEVIKLLEMLGGNINKKILSTANIGDVLNPHVYFFDPDSSDNRIVWYYLLGLEADGRASEMIIFTLEEFLEKYPFKVGDKVTLDNKLCSIIWMCWECNNVYYQVQGIGDVFTKKVTADELNPYKERNNMGKKLAIKGHPTRGEEVIQLLEMLGGTNDYFKHDGKIENFYYYIGNNNHIYQCGLPSEMKCFTLEEFEEKYPYKVMDKVVYKFINTYVIDTIKSMKWYANGVVYTLKEYEEELMAEDLQPNKEETMEDKGTLEQIDLTRELRIADEVEVILGDYEFVLKDGKTYFVKKNKYPKTYDECCDILRIETNRTIEHDNCLGYRDITLYDINLLTQLRYFRKLHICRDAYWKIAGEEMGLGKPWEYDMSKNEFSCAISYEYGSIQKCEVRYKNYFLVFPTKEMRDAFFENFKELIEKCKELL